MGYGFRFEISGDYACFTRPEFKVERVSYEVMTPSAARGILEAILWKPAIRYVIDEIAVCRPIRFVNIRRNEINHKMRPGTKYIVASEERAQRASMVLRDVIYVVSAHFVMTEKAGDADNEEKFSEMLRRRARKGQCYHHPYLGTREFPASVRLLDDDEKPEPIQESRSLGLMMHDFDFVKDANGNMIEWRPGYFLAALIDGVMNLRGIEVIR